MVLAGFGTSTQMQVADQANAAVDNVRLVLAAQELVHSLQRERGLTVGLVTGVDQYRSQAQAQRTQSDRARAALDRLLAHDGSADAKVLRRALDKLANLEFIRDSADEGKATRALVFNFYTTANVALNNATHESDVGVDDQELRRCIQALHVLGDAKEITGQERAHLNGVFAAGRFTSTDYVQFVTLRATRLDALTTQFSRPASARQRAAVDSALRTPQAVTVATYEKRALAGGKGQQLKLSPQTWWSAMTTLIDDMRSVQKDIGEQALARARQVKADAVRHLAMYAVGAVFTLALGVLLWLHTFQSITRPLQLLTREALETAEHKLPAAMARIEAAEDPQKMVVDPLPSELTGRQDEFAKVSQALDHLRQTAVRLAVEQAVTRHNTAESLANLGRRNQNLVRRQLGFISALEHEETDPGALANLFKLDHLATRMRRNAESLLVLVGERSPRRWRGAIAVGDVLRASFAEVEEYQRVILRRVDEARIKGTVAAEVSHVLAELIENALTCSPPHQEVEISGHSNGSRYHIAVVDAGVGMSPEAMAVANARLRGEHSFLVTPTRDLGHYVVGRLAQRLGIEVKLQDSPFSGVTARVTLPGALIEAEEPSAAPQRPAAAVAGATSVKSPLPRRGAADTKPLSTGAPMLAPEPQSPVENSPATTRNGLVKRRPRHRMPGRSEQLPRRDPPAAVDRSAGEVRSMLNDLQAGVRLAEEKNAPTHPGDQEA